jgi:hypothetical protein
MVETYYYGGNVEKDSWMVGLATDFLVQTDKPKHLSDAGSQPSQKTDGTVVTCFDGSITRSMCWNNPCTKLACSQH